MGMQKGFFCNDDSSGNTLGLSNATPLRRIFRKMYHKPPPIISAAVSTPVNERLERRVSEDKVV